MSFLRALTDSFLLLKKCPRFFLPKVVVAFLFFPIIILVTVYFVEFNFSSPSAMASRSQIELIALLMQMIFILIYTVLIYALDSFVINPMYPLLVEQYYKNRKINFRSAFLGVVKQFKVIFPALFLFSIILFMVMIPFLFILAISMLMKNDVLFYISIFTAVLSIFAVLILFYMIYPISSLEKIDFLKAVKQTMKSSVKHKGNVTKAVSLSLVVTGISYVLASAIVLTNPSGQILLTLSLFVLLVASRFLVAVFSTYQYILSSVFYFGFEKGIFLGK